MSWLVTGKQYIPAVLGEPWGGGYFAGYISHTANGNPTHALIVAPRETGYNSSGLQWKTTTTTTPGTTSSFDGFANTQAMVTAGIANHPAAQFCVNLTIGGYTDWYLPAILEHDIAYFNLKPTTALNDPNTNLNTNIYAVPSRNQAYATTYPTQTKITAFNIPTYQSGSQTFEADLNVNVAQYHVSSTEINASFAYFFGYRNGTRDTTPNNNNKTATRPVRAFRRIAL